MANIIILHPQSVNTKRLTHIETVANGHLRVKWTDETDTTEVNDYNFSLLTDHQTPQQIDIEIEDPLLSVVRFGDDFLWNLAYYHAEDATLVNLTDQGALPEDNGTYPQYPLWPSGETQAALTADNTLGHDTTLTYPQKQKRAVDSILAWRTQKVQWLNESLDYQDMHPELVGHIGLWLRSADAVLKRFFQDTDTDPLIVEAMAVQGAMGPPSIDDPVELFRNLEQLVETFPDGPNVAAIWVETQNVDDPEDVTRKSLLPVIQSIGGANDETYTLPTGYDSTVTNWILENQAGVISFDDAEPENGDTVTGTLSDPDGGEANITYQWQELISEVWQDIASETSAAYTIASAGSYRLVVTYDDNYGTGNTATSATLVVE